MNNACIWHFSDSNGDFSFKKLSLVQNVSNSLSTHYLCTEFMTDADKGGRVVVISVIIISVI